MDLVSIVIPVYKIESYIDRCIQSIQNQTYRNLEIILVDDGSPDSCGDICGHYAERDERIRVIHQENGGLSAARNTGIRAATGKHLLFVDGDDYIHKELVERTLKCAKEKQAQVVIFDYKSVEEDTGREDVWGMDLPKGKVLNAKVEPGILITTPGAWNKLYLKEFWDSCGLQYPVGRNYEDLSTTPKLLLQAERIVYLDSEPLYDYILRDGSIMRSHDYARSYANRTEAIGDVLQYFREQGKYETYKEELEYLTFEHGYFVPSKEIVLEDRNSPYLERFHKYAYGLFPNLNQNKYIRQCLSKKDRFLCRLLNGRHYSAMTILSRARKWVDSGKK